jgi:hypothetical protein
VHAAMGVGAPTLCGVKGPFTTDRR